MSSQLSNTPEKKTRVGLLGAVIGAVAASICCVGPLVLLALGVGGAWVSSLTVLEPYRPFLILITLSFLGYAFYRVYRKPEAEECEDGSYCANPKSDRINKISLWIVTVLVLGLIAFPYVVPTGTAASSSQQTSQPQQPVHTKQVVLKVDGMTCNGCVLTVNKSLKKLPGVLNASITLKPPRATVEYDPTKVTPEQMIWATTDAGYPASVLETEGETP